jgi:G3E family GTPase
MDQGTAVKKIPFILITGFLGSGKTTLLLDILRRYASRLRISIVQNEFSPGHFDGTTLKSSGHSFDLLEINNGSVFCACQLSNFIERIDPFIEDTRPDFIMLEATGLADPVSLGQILHTGKLSERIYLAASWCVVDAVNFFHIIETVSRAQHQVRIADTVWINKTDLNPETQVIRDRIRKINPFVPILDTRYGSIASLDLEDLIRNNQPVPTPDEGATSEPRPDIGSCVVRSNKYFDRESVERFLGDSPVDLMRIKGYIRINEKETLVVQGVFKETTSVIIENYQGPTELIVLGKGLNNRDFSKQFLALQSNR